MHKIFLYAKATNIYIHKSCALVHLFYYGSKLHKTTIQKTNIFSYPKLLYSYVYMVNL